MTPKWEWIINEDKSGAWWRLELDNQLGLSVEPEDYHHGDGKKIGPWTLWMTHEFDGEEEYPSTFKTAAAAKRKGVLLLKKRIKGLLKMLENVKP